MYDNHPKMRNLYVGVDCHKHTHTAAIINCFNEKLDILTFKNTQEDFNKLMDMVNSHATNGLTPIYGLEDTKHLGYKLATFLLNKNCEVKNVLSTLTYNERKKNPIISKDDEIDALCIAKVLLDNLDTLTTAQNDEIYWTLKQVVKMKRAITKDSVIAKNKLHAQLLHHYPNYKEFFSYFDCQTALELWEQYPSPDLLIKLSLEELQKFIWKASKGKVYQEQIQRIYNLVRIEDYEEVSYQEERNILITTLVRQIKTNKERITEIEKNIVSLYDKLDFKLHTVKGLSKTASAEILSEIGNINRFPTSDKLARYAGIAPINFSSGNSNKNIRNEFGNRQLNFYIHCLAVRSISPGKTRTSPQNAIFIEYYHRKISQGKNKQQSLTCVMRRLVNIIYKMLKNNTEFIMPPELTEKCKNIYLEKMKQEKDKEPQK